MIATRRGFLRGLVAVVAAAALPITARQTPSVNAAPDVPPTASRPPAMRVVQTAEWAPLGPPALINRLFTPASGALFAAAQTALYRSDDAGANWRETTLPAPRRANATVEVDPSNHRVIYADTDAGIQRTDDDAVTWTNVLPSNRKTLRVAISPADPRIVYAAQSSDSSGDFWFLRSTDWGATWEELDHQRQSPCSWNVMVLTPHPTDSARIFRTASCYAGRNLSGNLEESKDNGSTWRTLLSPQTAFPRAIVGGGGAEPGRFFVSANKDNRGGGSTVFMSADDAETWTPVMEHSGGGTMSGSHGPITTIGGLTYDAAMPTNAYVGLNSMSDPSKPVDIGSVNGTSDGGVTWMTLGQQALPHLQMLALGIDGRNLFAATVKGVMRLSLG